MTIDDKNSRVAGRPRCEQIDRAIIAATENILDEQGFAKLSMEGIAARAGVSKATVYRRWTNKTVLVLDLIHAFLSQHNPWDKDVPLQQALEQELRNIQALFASPLGRALPGILAMTHEDQALGELFVNDYVQPRREEIKQLLETTIGKSKPGAKLDQDLLLDTLAGPLFHRLLMTRQAVDDNYIRQLVAQGMRMIEDSGV